MGDLNLLGWVVLKLNVSLSDELNKPLVTKCALSKTYFQKKLVTTDYQRRILSPSNYNDNPFKKNVDVQFHILEKKFRYDFSVAMYYLKTKYGFSLLDFKMYRPNLITNDGLINHHQNTYRDYQVTFPKTVIKLKKPQITRNKHQNDKDIQYNFISKL